MESERGIMCTGEESVDTFWLTRTWAVKERREKEVIASGEENRNLSMCVLNHYIKCFSYTLLYC